MVTFGRVSRSHAPFTLSVEFGHRFPYLILLVLTLEPFLFERLLGRVFHLGHALGSR